MVGRTHDLAAFTALSLVAVVTPEIQGISLATAITAFIANFLGGLAPDLDNSTSSFWNKIRGGSILGKLISPFIGGHRNISHSFVGIILFGLITEVVLTAASQVLLVDMRVVWWAFMIGVMSHIFMDALTREGVPLLFPLDKNFGFPPFKGLRVRTGGWVEKLVVFPSLVIITILLYYYNYNYFLSLLEF
jgi:inner membrane protein